MEDVLHSKCKITEKNNENIFCIENKKNKRFYEKDGINKEVSSFIGYESDIGECLEDDIHNLCEKGKILPARKDELIKLFDYIDLLQEKSSEDESSEKVNKHVFKFLKKLLTVTNITLETLNEILNGAFTIIVGDNGYFYNKYEGKSVIIEQPIYLHMSSHWSKHEQHRNGLGTLYNIKEDVSTTFDLLMGTSILPEFQGCTWFQFENSRTSTIYTKIIHSFDFLKYLNPFKEKKNIGPFGDSLYIELAQKGPLLLKVCNNDNPSKECIFNNDDPIKNSSNYWNDTPISIYDYNKLCKIIYRIGDSNIVRQGFRYKETGDINIYEILEDLYKELIKDTELHHLREKIINIDKLKNHSTEYDFSKKYRPDDLVMIVYKIILDTITDIDIDYNDDIIDWSEKIMNDLQEESLMKTPGGGNRRKKTRMLKKLKSTNKRKSKRRKVK